MPKKLTPLNIKDPEVYQMARRLAHLRRQSITEAVRQSLRETLVREERRRPNPDLRERLLEIAHRCDSLPVLDPRSPDEILGYDEHGIPR